MSENDGNAANALVIPEDINKLRKSWESGWQWILRRDFILKNKERFNPEQLLQLAQLFVNVEFHGAIYSSDVMNQLNECIHGIDSLDEYRGRMILEAKCSYYKLGLYHLNPGHGYGITYTSGFKRGRGRGGRRH